MSEWRAVVAVESSEPITEDQRFAALHHLRDLGGSCAISQARACVEFRVSYDYESEAHATRELTHSVLMALTTVGVPMLTVRAQTEPVCEDEAGAASGEPPPPRKRL